MVDCSNWICNSRYTQLVKIQLHRVSSNVSEQNISWVVFCQGFTKTNIQHWKRIILKLPTITTRIYFMEFSNARNHSYWYKLNTRNTIIANSSIVSSPNMIQVTFKQSESYIIRRTHIHLINYNIKRNRFMEYFCLISVQCTTR